MNTRFNRLALSVVVCFGTALATQAAFAADSFTEALTGGKAKLNMNLRRETVDQDNAAEDASALTLRTRLGYQTGAYKGFSAYIEAEDSRVVFGQNEYKFGPMDTGSPYSVIADPEVTEVEQAFISYKVEGVTGKLGRQVYTLDGHRHVGHVGWRQDRQTFDALTVDLEPIKGLQIKLAHLYKRNRIFGELADVDSKDNLVNVSYVTSFGKIVGYGYFLEEDNATKRTFDTTGISFNGSAPATDKLKILYGVEFATQTKDEVTTPEADELDADYMLIEGGISVSGLTVKLGHEVLGSDGGAYGFSTPLATLHKFNGWADVFLGTPASGLVDDYLSAAYAINGGKGGKLVFAYHTYSADETAASTDPDDFGSEIDLLYTKAFTKNYSAGIKLARYSADDWAVDTDKLWFWVNAKF